MDSSASIDIKSLQKSPSNCLKRAPSDFKQSCDDNEFANRLNAKRSTSVRGTSYSLADLQLATGNFATGRLLGEGSIGRVYRAKYADGKVFSAWLLHLLPFQLCLPNSYAFLGIDRVRESPLIASIILSLYQIMSYTRDPRDSLMKAKRPFKSDLSYLLSLSSLFSRFCLMGITIATNYMML